MSSLYMSQQQHRSLHAAHISMSYQQTQTSDTRPEGTYGIIPSHHTSSNSSLPTDSTGTFTRTLRHKQQTRVTYPPAASRGRLHVCVCVQADTRQTHGHPKATWTAQPPLMTYVSCVCVCVCVCSHHRHLSATQWPHSRRRTPATRTQTDSSNLPVSPQYQTGTHSRTRPEFRYHS
jgi:hypothetical protein